MHAILRATFYCGLLAIGGCSNDTRSSPSQSAAAGGSTPDGTTQFCRLTMQPEALGDCALLAEQYESLAAGVDAFLPNASMREYEETTIRYAITRLPDEVQGERGELAEAIDEAPVAVPAAPADMAPLPEPLPSPEPAPTGPTRAEIDEALMEAEENVSAAVTPERDIAPVETRVIKLGRRMHACLDADSSFTIAGAACRTIDTFERPIAVWRWTVTPTQPGNHTLVVQSSVELTAADGSARLIPQRAQDAAIAVEVTAYGRWMRFLDDAVAWVRSPLGLLAALTAFSGAVGLLVGAIRRARRGEGRGEGPAAR